MSLFQWFYLGSSGDWIWVWSGACIYHWLPDVAGTETKMVCWNHWQGIGPEDQEDGD